VEFQLRKNKTDFIIDKTVHELSISRCYGMQFIANVGLKHKIGSHKIQSHRGTGFCWISQRAIEASQISSGIFELIGKEGCGRVHCRRATKRAPGTQAHERSANYDEYDINKGSHRHNAATCCVETCVFPKGFEGQMVPKSRELSDFVSLQFK
jgi:hypothetical protein